MMRNDFQHNIFCVLPPISWESANRCLPCLKNHWYWQKILFNLNCKKAEIDIDRRAGTLSLLIYNPKQLKVPDWFVNRQKDFVTGKITHCVIDILIGAVCSDIARMKKDRV